jgi:hypothetical protein
MSDREEPVGPHGVVELISAIAAKGESGRLDIFAGATDGELLFKTGKLVDARLGYLRRSTHSLQCASIVFTLIRQSLRQTPVR